MKKKPSTGVPNTKIAPAAAICCSTNVFADSAVSYDIQDSGNAFTPLSPMRSAEKPPHISAVRHSTQRRRSSRAVPRPAPKSTKTSMKIDCATSAMASLVERMSAY